MYQFLIVFQGLFTVPVLYAVLQGSHVSWKTVDQFPSHGIHMENEGKKFKHWNFLELRMHYWAIYQSSPKSYVQDDNDVQMRFCDIQVRAV